MRLVGDIWELRSQEEPDMYAHTRELAFQQGRQIHTALTATMNSVVALAAGAALAFNAVNEPFAEIVANADPDGATPTHDLYLWNAYLSAITIFVPLLIAFWICALAISQRSWLVPHPDPPRVDDLDREHLRQLRPAQYCLEVSIHHNQHQRTKLAVAWTSTILATMNFGTWATFGQQVPEKWIEAFTNNPAGSLLLLAAAAFLVVGIFAGRKNHPAPPLKDALASGKVITLAGRGTLFAK